ncbi:uncharacterized protein L969DRAFT_88352 [Mixia osmundae IAM 14324]|uniref:uncharacterized protein n=1 Tax=Mixia osmundae (strain CBS 9802 / IAM 14324 / JCM 22182 / KY 12970) TaxID=764103 RepID=UPI0004A55788|nr:uncharacterized protein L969DRAFT_88352 [Mixia osmundae IAM 14324]KEI38967.1 hypothetical protein L969DRAFT_88352 [Mixia osmundae IAM 14324]
MLIAFQQKDHFKPTRKIAACKSIVYEYKTGKQVRECPASIYSARADCTETRFEICEEDEWLAACLIPRPETPPLLSLSWRATSSEPTVPSRLLPPPPGEARQGRHAAKLGR